MLPPASGRVNESVCTHACIKQTCQCSRKPAGARTEEPRAKVFHLAAPDFSPPWAALGFLPPGEDLGVECSSVTLQRPL